MAESEPEAPYYHVSTWTFRHGSGSGGLSPNRTESDVIRYNIIPHVIYLLAKLKRDEYTYIVRSSDIEHAIEQIKESSYIDDPSSISEYLRFFDSKSARHTLHITRTEQKLNPLVPFIWIFGIFHTLVGKDYKQKLIQKFLLSAGFEERILVRNEKKTDLLNPIQIGQFVAGSVYQKTIIKNDFNSLSKFLTDQGISFSDVLELKTALDEEEREDASPGTSEKVRGWVGKMVEKSATGAWNYASGKAGELLKGAIEAYLGL